MEFQSSILLAGAPPALGGSDSPSGGIGAGDELDELRKNHRTRVVRVVRFEMRAL